MEDVDQMIIHRNRFGRRKIGEPGIHVSANGDNRSYQLQLFQYLPRADVACVNDQPDTFQGEFYGIP
jgi:hypothetical protein